MNYADASFDACVSTLAIDVIPEVDQVYRYVTGELRRTVKGISKATVREYKREIPPDEKGRVTADLRSGATLGVISTTALQLGIDIGDLSVCVV